MRYGLTCLPWPHVPGIVVIDIACSVNESTEKTTSKNQIFIIPAVLRPNVLRVCLALRHDNALGQHSSFRRKIATVASYWQMFVRFDRPRISTPDLPHQSWEQRWARATSKVAPLPLLALESSIAIATRYSSSKVARYRYLTTKVAALPATLNNV